MLIGEDEFVICGLLDLYGKDDLLGYFVICCDKLVVFVFSGCVCIIYCVEVGVCLVSGDLVGDYRVWL